MHMMVQQLTQAKDYSLLWDSNKGTTVGAGAGDHVFVWLCECVFEMAWVLVSVCSSYYKRNFQVPT